MRATPYPNDSKIQSNRTRHVSDCMAKDGNSGPCINPVDWYATVLSRVIALETNEIEQLLPHNWSRPPEPQAAGS